MARSTNVVKRHYSDLIQVLSASQDTLFVITSSFYQADLIDRSTKNTVFTSDSLLASSRILLDHIEMKVDQSNDYLPIVLQVLGEQVALKDIVVKMNTILLAELEEKRNTEEQTDSTPIAQTHMVSSTKTIDDIESTISSVNRLKEAFDALLLLVITTIGRTNINLAWLKLRICLFFQYAHETTPEVQSILDELEVHGHSPEGVVAFLVSRNLLGYLNFELLKVFTEFLCDSSDFDEKLEEYTKRHKIFFHHNLKNIVKVFKQKPKLAPASVVGLPEITVELEEPWQGKSYYQWKEIMQEIVDWPDHLLIKNVDISCVIIKYYVFPFILSRVVNDLSNEAVIGRLSAVGAKFIVSEEVLELAKTDSEWISAVVEQASELEKEQIEDSEAIPPEQQEENELEPPPVVQSSPAHVSPKCGFDDEMFLSPPPEHLQCSICYLTLREPHQLTCCGALLCLVCAVNSGAKLQCPCCRDTNHMMIMDRNARRQIVGLKVKCTRSHCHWCGEVLNLDSHLNRNCPQPIVEPRAILKVFSAVLPVYRIVKDFNQLKRKNDEYYSDPFYTTQGGYKLTLNIVPNGAGAGKGTHVSVYLCLMKGENDQNLPFPFSGIFTIQLLSLKIDTHHVEESVVFDQFTAVQCKQKVTIGEMAEGWGKEKYLSHTELEESSDKEYIHQDMLYFNIQFHPLFEPIQPTVSPVPSWCDVINSESATPPCTRTLYSYTAYKRTNKEWWSSPFHSKDEGYKLQLRVYVKGFGFQRGTHLSLAVYLLKGEHDDKLQWPFNAMITIQLLNWTRDNNHKELTIHHHRAPLTNRTRVTEGERAPGGWGYSRFISHSDVEDVTSDTMYINNDAICFRIAECVAYNW